MYEISHRHTYFPQDNYNALHIAAMYSREDVVKLLLSKRGVDPYATGGVRKISRLVWEVWKRLHISVSNFKLYIIK